MCLYSNTRENEYRETADIWREPRTQGRLQRGHLPGRGAPVPFPSHSSSTMVVPFFPVGPWREAARGLRAGCLGVLFRSLRPLAHTSRMPSAGRRQQALLVLKHAVAALERVESIRVPDAAVRPYVQRVVHGLGLPVGSVTWRGAASHGAGVGRGRGRGRARRRGWARGRGGAGAPTCCLGWRPGSGHRSS